MPGSWSIKQLDSDKTYLIDGGTLTIGRDPANDVHIDDRDVSRRHALIEFREDSITLTDCQSTNGTLLNDWRVTRTERLEAGDRITIADIIFEVQQSESQASGNTSFRSQANDSTRFRQSEDTSFRNNSGGPPGGNSGGHDFEENNTQFKNPMKTGAPDLSAIAGLSNAAAALIRHTGRNQILLYVLEQNHQNRWLIGRQRDCDITIEDNAVSRQHCLIQKRGDRWQIDDQQSRNGTYVNDLAVNMTYLSSGDRVTFGNIDVIFLPLS